MRVALTGVSGFIGSVIAKRLCEAGHTVTGLVRATSRRDHIESFVDRFVVGDQSDESAWPAFLDEAECLIHNSFDWQALRSGAIQQHYQNNLVSALRLIDKAANRRIIYMSSVAVHHDMRPRWAGMVDEDHPTRPAHLYGACKVAIEAHLWSAHFSRAIQFAALRPCAVYGIDPDLTRSIGYPIVKRVMEGKSVNKQGGGKFVHVDDVAAVTCAVLAQTSMGAAVYNLADCYARWADLGLMAREILGADVQVDTSSPPAPHNQFTKDAVQSLGVEMDRGHYGLRDHLQELISLMSST